MIRTTRLFGCQRAWPITTHQYCHTHSKPHAVAIVECGNTHRQTTHSEYETMKDRIYHLEKKIHALESQRASDKNTILRRLDAIEDDLRTARAVGVSCLAGWVLSRSLGMYWLWVTPIGQ